MKVLIPWLIEMEERAEKIYAKASAAFSGDKELSDFFKDLSSEEASHRALIEKAAGLIKDIDVVSPIIVDETAREEVAGHFSRCERLMEEEPVDCGAVLGCVVSAEFSEWNEYFLYVINRLKPESSEFVKAAVYIQHHKKRIEEFVAGRAELKGLLDRIKGLPRVWEDSILVVEDDDDIRGILKEVLFNEGLVDTAGNGREGLEKIAGRYYSVILSDWDMPVMNGMELYKAALAKYPGIGDRFIFFTGEIDAERGEFLQNNGLKFLSKPASIREIRKAVAGVLSS